MSNLGTLERAVQRACIKWMRHVLPAGSIVAAIVNEQRGASDDPTSRMRYGMARKASGVVSGFFDAVAVLPAGRTVWWEFKRPEGGVLSDDQRMIHEQARALGHVVLIATSIETARLGLQANGIPLREAPGQMVAQPIFRIAKVKQRLPEDAIPF